MTYLINNQMRMMVNVYVSENHLSREQSSKHYNQIQFHDSNLNKQSNFALCSVEEIWTSLWVFVKLTSD
jgi:hypothetical protein